MKKTNLIKIVAIIMSVIALMGIFILTQGSAVATEDNNVKVEIEPLKTEDNTENKIEKAEKEDSTHKIEVVIDGEKIAELNTEKEPEYDIEVLVDGEKVVDTIDESTKPFDIDLSIVGDCMLATYKGQYYDGSFSWYAANKEPSYFLEKVQDIFSKDDFTLANLENVLTDNKLSEVKKDHNPAYWFKAPTKNINILTAGSIEAVSLANNHFGDYGTQGRKDTMTAVESANIPYGTNDKTFYLEKNGFKIAVICNGLWSEWQADSIITRIKEASKVSDYQIVFYHGGKEGTHSPEDWKIRASRKLVDAGADLVIGNHPHVLQPMETYNGVNIVYSLGNFCYGGSKSPENRTVIYKHKITVDPTTNKVTAQSHEIVPCYVYTGKTNNWQPAVITNEAEKKAVIEFMSWNRKSPF